MKAYNIYNDRTKINKNPLNLNELRKVYEKEFIYKSNPINNKIEKIPTKNLRTVQCIII